MSKQMLDRKKGKSLNLRLITVTIAVCLLVPDAFLAIPTPLTHSEMEMDTLKGTLEPLQDTEIVLLCPQSGRLVIGGGNFATWRQPITRNARRNPDASGIATIYTVVGLRIMGPAGEVFYADSFVVLLLSGGVASVTLTWDGADPGPIYGSSTGVTWTLYVEGWPINSNAVDGNPSNNVIYVGQVIIMTLTGDITNNGIVDIFDAISLALAFGSKTGDPSFNDAADINGSGNIDIFDAILVSNNYGRTVPP